MHGNKKTAFFILILFLIISCRTSSDKKTASDSNQEKKTILEAESFNLKDCTIINNLSASSGRAVKLNNTGSEGYTEIKLPKGEYILQAAASGGIISSGSFYIRIGPQEIKFAVKNPKKFEYCESFLVFKINEKALQPIMISYTFADQGVMIDKIEIIEKSLWHFPIN